MNENKIEEKLLLKLKEHGFQNFLQQNEHGVNALMYSLLNNVYKNLNLKKNEWDYLIQHTDLKQKDKNGNIALEYAIKENYLQKIYLTQNQFDNLIKNSSLQKKQIFDILMDILFNNEKHKLHLSEKQLNYLIKNSNLKQKTKSGFNVLMYALLYNNSENINLTEDQWDYLIKHSNIKQQTTNDRNAFMIALDMKLKNNLNFSDEKICQLWNPLSEEQKQNTFIIICKEYNKKKLNETSLIFLLYDLRFQPNQETIHFLQENQNKKFLEMIKKRDLLLNLKQELSIKNNIIPKIKI
jgi:hypothetical protein